MPDCNKCLKSESADNAIVTCDRCSKKHCRECSGLTTTEMRAVAVKSRVIKFYCQDCNLLPGNSSYGSSDELLVLLKPLFEKIAALERSNV